ncbi:ParB N-terminal domain-containing protein (plasmid) [Pseudomonas silvicola]|nr:ParB N-terminal domain-containing protein [Pseudomonas silvicola]
MPQTDILKPLSFRPVNVPCSRLNTLRRREEKTYVVMETNGRDQSGLTPESLRDIIRTIKLQQFFPAIGVKRTVSLKKILDGSRRRAAALHCKTGLD